MIALIQRDWSDVRPGDAYYQARDGEIVCSQRLPGDRWPDVRGSKVYVAEVEG